MERLFSFPRLLLCVLVGGGFDVVTLVGGTGAGGGRGVGGGSASTGATGGPSSADGAATPAPRAALLTDIRKVLLLLPFTPLPVCGWPRRPAPCLPHVS